MIGLDGFTYYDCSECGTTKLAAMFTPQEIEGARRCRVCTGELSRLNGKARRPTEAQQPRQVFAAPGAVSMRDSR